MLPWAQSFAYSRFDAAGAASTGFFAPSPQARSGASATAGTSHPSERSSAVRERVWRGGVRDMVGEFMRFAPGRLLRDGPAGERRPGPHPHPPPPSLGRPAPPRAAGPAVPGGVGLLLGSERAIEGEAGSSGAALLEVEAAMALAVVSRVIRRPLPTVIDRGAERAAVGSGALAGAFAAIVVAAARRAHAV